MALLELPDDHDLAHLKAALEYVGSFRTAVDVGAHRGIWTRYLMQRFDAVHAFEPVPALFLQNPAENKYCCALGESFGHCSIAPGDRNTGQGYVIAGAEVEIWPLDDFDLADVDFLKVDVEGYELNVLKGAYDTIVDSQPVILLEQNGLSRRYHVTDGDISSWLSEIGYEFVKKWHRDYLYVPSRRAQAQNTAKHTSAH